MFEHVGTYDVTVNVDDGCGDITTWGPVTVNTVTYTVTYDLNGGTSGSQTDGSSPYFEGVEVTVLNQGSMLKTNYHFTGWKNGGGTAYAVGATFTMPASNVILYAQWTVDTKYNVTYDLNGGTSGSQTDGSSPYFEGVEVTVLNENDMVKTNYHFTGWKNGGGTVYAVGDKFNMPAENVTLYAQWVCNPCSGWDTSDVSVVLWYADPPGKNDPRIDVDGEITGPACAEITKIDIEFVLYTNGGKDKETYSDTLTLQNNSFTIELDIDPASYNAADNYELYVKLPECGLIMIKSGPVAVEE